MNEESIEKPSISVIINNYNYGRFLVQCIESVLQQKVRPKELIIVDDGSTDNSRSILENYQKDALIVLKENGGQASAMNAGWQNSSGDWILFLDADDFLMPEAIEKLQEVIQPEYSRIHYGMWICDADSKKIGTLPRDLSLLYSGSLSQFDFVNSGLHVLPTSGNLFNKQFLDSIMPIEEDYFRICADTYLLFADIRKQHLHFLPERIAVYRSHGNNHYFQINQFDTNISRVLLQVRTAVKTIDMFINQNLLGEALPRSRYYENLLDLTALKNGIILHRKQATADLDEFIDVRTLARAADKRIAQITSSYNRRIEHINMFIIRRFPLWSFPIFTFMERFMKRMRTFFVSNRK